MGFRATLNFPTINYGLSYSQYACYFVNPAIFISGKDADLLIHEATFEDDLKAEAVAKKHRFKLKYFTKRKVSTTENIKGGTHP